MSVEPPQDLVPKAGDAPAQFGVFIEQPNGISQSGGVSPIAKLQSVLAKPFMPAVFFLCGVGYDSLTLSRIDRLVDNLVLLLYLLLLGALIVLTGRLGIESPPEREQLLSGPKFTRWVWESRPYYPMASQFLLGGLFSAYAIFYSQSATFTKTAVFFALLIVLLVTNEFLRDRLSNLRILVGLYAVVSFAFFTFFVPVITGFMNTVIFLLGALLSLGVTLYLVQQVYRNNPDQSGRQPVKVMAPAIVLIAMLVGFYFLNWIPPVPLSLKHGGIYHEIKRTGDQFELVFEKQWYQFWKRADTTFPTDEPVYCFTAVFAPVDLNTTIYHHWHYRSNDTKPFMHADRIPIKISGGREGGYRAYSLKQRLDPGDWRIDVETEDGRVIGRVEVTVATKTEAQPRLVSVTY
ncbi:MAG: DUF2914 domain-containing protein [Nitrospira sp. WS238]|nr:DUF2914 domain-containing protein [Nitrospira sp. WS238]